MMKASVERKLMRWVHIVLSIPVVGYIYGPVASIPVASLMVRWVIFPIIVLSGLWLWKGHLVKKWFRKTNG
jgi:thiosulfate reductase cytochrome b subunit